MRMHYQVLLLSLAAVLLWQQQCLAEPENARMLIACSPYVYPCECGLCPRIVNCKSTMSAECFCGTAAAGSYPHPKDQSKFWMCSYDKKAQIHYGVEVNCPGRLVFDRVSKVCTLPAAAITVANTNSSSIGKQSVAAANSSKA